MADFQPNTIYGYPGGELIGTRRIMMQVEDYAQTIWCTYRHNHVLPLVYLKAPQSIMLCLRIVLFLSDTEEVFCMWGMYD